MVLLNLFLLTCVVSQLLEYKRITVHFKPNKLSGKFLIDLAMKDGEIKIRESPINSHITIWDIPEYRNHGIINLLKNCEFIEEIEEDNIFYI